MLWNIAYSCSCWGCIKTIRWCKDQFVFSPGVRVNTRLSSEHGRFGVWLISAGYGNVLVQWSSEKGRSASTMYIVQQLIILYMRPTVFVGIFKCKPTGTSHSCFFSWKVTLWTFIVIHASVSVRDVWFILLNTHLMSGWQRLGCHTVSLDQ